MAHLTLTRQPPCSWLTELMLKSFARPQVLPSRLFVWGIVVKPSRGKQTWRTLHPDYSRSCPARRKHGWIKSGGTFSLRRARWASHTFAAGMQRVGNI